MDYKMKMKRPASWWNDNWREGTPLGNGLHGALMYGNTANERIMLTHTRLWREGKSMELPDVSDVLPKMRELIFAGEVPKADRMLADALIERGYKPHEAYPFPAADLNITMPAVKGFSKYSRGLDMSTAEAYVRYEDGIEKITRRGFVSRVDDVVVIECHPDSHITLSAHKTDVTNAPVQLPESVLTRTDGEWIYYKATISDVEYGAVAKIVRKAKTLALVRLYTEGTSDTKWDQLKAYLERLPADYEALLKRHVTEHQRLFSTCEFKLEDDRFSREAFNEELLDASYDEGLPNVLAERLWAYGRYLLICGTQTGGLPCNLTGLWSGEYRAFWAFNMANINLEMTYWQVLPGKLTELMLPLFDYYDAAMEEMRENASKIYGCRGILLPAVTMPGGMKHVCLAPHITNWTAGAGWIAQHYYDYYRFTHDVDFLINRGLPFMTEAARFYSDFVVWQGEKWHVCPSVSPENHTRNYKRVSKDLDDLHTLNDLGDGTQSSIDAAMDIAVIRELFLHLVEIGNTTNFISDEIMQTYHKMLSGAPDYQVNEWGAPREWLHEDFPDNDLHRHQSHLYPMFPGLELARRGAETTEIYQQGAHRRMTIGLSFQTSWSLIQNANTMARVRDAENAWESLNLIAKTCLMNNLFTTHNDWRGSGITLDFPMAPFQIDANTGWPSAVQEMLLFSDVKRIDLLPALPKRWLKGSIGSMDTRCGVNVDITWNVDENAGNAKLCAIRDAAFILYLPDGESMNTVLITGECKVVNFGFR